MNKERKEQIRYFGFAGVVGVLLLLNLVGIWRTVFGVDTAAILTVLAGYRIFLNSIRSLLNREISADLAICIAVIAALTVGEYLAAAEAMFIMLLGEGLEGYAAGRTSAAIERFVEQMPRRARRLRNGEEEEVDAAALEPDDHIIVRAGERIAADGNVAEGASAVDEATITGEPVPRDKEPGDEVFAGTLNGNGRLVIRVTKAGQETTLARVVALVEEARERQAPVVRLADQYAKYFLPALLLAGGLTWWYTRDWLRTVAVLLVACPCALILATPTAMVAAIGGLARRGILVRGGTVLQQAAACDTVVFDKTGTVTEGRFEVQRIIALEGREDDVLRAAAAAEAGSTHPLARVIVEAAERRGWREPSTDSVVVPGRGAQAHVNGALVRSGNRAFLEAAGIVGASPLIDEADRTGATAVLVARDETLLGAVLLRDRLREGIQPAMAELTALGFSGTILLTGDRRRPAEVIAREAGIPNVEAELLPEDKLERVRDLMSQGRKVAMIGDGVNDAPALAAAHTGIAVSGASDITAEAADVVYMGHSLEKLPKLFDISRRAVRTAWQNIVLFAGVVNVLAVAAAATGTIGPLGAAFTHQLSSFFVMLNSLRLLRVEGRESRLRSWERGWWEQLQARRPAWSWREHAARLWNARERWWRPALAALAAVIVLSGITIIQPEELGVIERFGRKQLPYWQPGLHYKLPWPVDELTRIPARRVRVVEIGFRSGAVRADEPDAYEWNVQHRSGRFQRKPEESQMLAGDQNMIEVNATVHYRIARPDEFVFGHKDAETTVRAAAESVLQGAITSADLDAILTTGRRELEERIAAELTRRLEHYAAGVELLSVRLLDVHPAMEVVDAFREVAGASEEKSRLMNVAEGYRNEQVATARGRAEAEVRTAQGYSAGRRNRSAGDASRFVQAEGAYRSAPGVHDLRLYLEAMEQVLPGKKKLIVDGTKARRHLVLIEDGVELSPTILPRAAERPQEEP